MAWGYENPWRVVALWLAITLIASVGALRIKVETSTDSILDRSSDAWTFYQESQRLFGGDEILTLLIEAPERFDPRTLSDVIELTKEFETLKGVQRVDSLASVPLVHPTHEGDVHLESALHEGVPQSAAEVAQLEALIQADRIAPSTLMSEDGKYFGINVVLEQGAERYYEEVLDRIERRLESRSAWVSGVPVFRVETDSRTRSQLALFTPITILAMGVLIFALFGSVGAVLMSLGSSGLATWCVIGTMGALGVPVTITTVVLPSILLALGCAYNMHLLTAFMARQSAGRDLDSLLPVALPIALSGLTTAVGFIAVSFVRIDAIRDIGGFGALGVVVLLASTLTVTPAALRRWPLRKREVRFQPWLSTTGAEAVVRVAESRRRLILIGWLIAGVTIGIGVARVSVETDVIVWFPEDDPIRSAYTTIRRELSGISPMNVVLTAPVDRSVIEPEVLAKIDSLGRHLESLEPVGRAISAADLLEQMHGAYMGAPQTDLPQDFGLISQYLVLLEAKDYIFDLLTADRGAANVVLRVNDNSSAVLMSIARQAETWWAENGIDGIEARTTGIMYEFARAEDEIAYGQLRGLVFALVAITAILMAIFRWPRLALIALAPNAIPVAMAFGFMGLSGVPLDAGTVVLGNLALGIAVDDTIHVVSGFYGSREEGNSPRDAIQAAFVRSLPAVVFTTVAVSIGFLILGISDFTVTRHLGLLTAGIMVLCLLANLLLLPAFLLKLERIPRRTTFSAPKSQDPA